VALVLPDPEHPRSLLAAAVFWRVEQRDGDRPREVGRRIREVKEEPERRLGRGQERIRLPASLGSRTDKAKGSNAPATANGPCRCSELWLVRKGFSRAPPPTRR
jgi:hypothetical protein